MSLSVLDMSVSVDGFVADAHDYLGGEDGERLHAWAASSELSRPVQQFEDEWNAAGAILAGRRTAELMDQWGGSHGGLPIFVPSHRPPPPAPLTLPRLPEGRRLAAPPAGSRSPETPSRLAATKSTEGAKTSCVMASRPTGTAKQSS